jgi:hypothetical protein
LRHVPLTQYLLYARQLALKRVTCSRSRRLGLLEFLNANLRGEQRIRTLTQRRLRARQIRLQGRDRGLRRKSDSLHFVPQGR